MLYSDSVTNLGLDERGALILFSMHDEDCASLAFARSMLWGGEQWSGGLWVIAGLEVTVP